MRKIFIILFTIVVAKDLAAQNPSFNPTIDIYPKTPDAAASSKHIDIPPGNFTGVADFTIPIYTIDAGAESIPIELQYTTTGIKVGEIASRVGLGWALNTGPHLSQQIMGGLDKRPERPYLLHRSDIPEYGCSKGFVYTYTDPCGIALNSVGVDSFGDGLKYDQLPDIYSYSLLNVSGQYILDYSGEFGIPRPFNMTKIKPVMNSYNTRVAGMELTDEKGNLYYFKNNNILGEGVIRNTSTCDPNAVAIDYDYEPNYRIEKITLPNKKEVTYTYNKNTDAQYVTSIMEQRNIAKTWVPYDEAPFSPLLLPPDRCVNKTQSSDLALTQISFDGGKVLFYYNNDPGDGFTENTRQDLVGEVYLTKVLVKDNNNHTIKDISLVYEYFQSPDSVPSEYTYTFSNSIAESKRLKLKEVRDNLTSGEYSFSYYGEEENQPLPNRMSFSQDFWGVYNGEPNTTPIATVKTDFMLNKTKVFLGANKQPNFNYGVIGNLKKIKYPSGGSTIITYEADEYYSEATVPIYEYTESPPVETSVDQYPVEFEIPANNRYNQQITVEYTDIPNEPGDPPVPTTGSTCRWTLEKKDTNGQYIIIESMKLGSSDREDGPGMYRLKIEVPVDYRDVTSQCNIYYSWVNEFLKTDSHIRNTGSIRVKQIESNSQDNGKIIRKYTYTNPLTNQTSGYNQGEEEFVSLKQQQFDLPRTSLPLGPPARYMKYLSRTNNPGWQINTTRGKAVSYEYVQEIYQSSLDPSKNYKKQLKFKTEPGSVIYDLNTPINISWPLQDLDNGLLLWEEMYDNNGLIRKTEFEYNIDPYFNNDITMRPYSYSLNPIAVGMEIQVRCIMQLGQTSTYYFNAAEFNIGNIWIKNVKTTTTEYKNNLPIMETVQTTAYSSSNTDRHIFPIEQTTKVSGSNQILSQLYQYPQDLNKNYLTGKHIIGIPLITEVKKNGETISKTEAVYPISEADAKSRNIDNKDIPVPFDVFSNILGDSEMKKTIAYNKYDEKGNIVQYTLNPVANGSGTPVTIIWGYNQTQPIAKIEGATYAQVSSLASSIVNASNTDAAAAPGNDESAFLSVLNTFRTNSSLNGYQVTTYTYDPLIGVRSITPPSGITEFYNYDTAGRLKEIKDINGNILKQFEYNYKH